MHAYLGGTLNELDSPVLTVGGPADHVHILCALSKNMAVSEVIGKVKRSSSKWVKTKGRALKKFAWQNGYGVFSVSQSQVERVRSYIHTQEDHHRRKTFQDEFRALLESYHVDFDERYVWD
jgi:REP element-mobilizing transposase RayT